MYQGIKNYSLKFEQKSQDKQQANVHNSYTRLVAIASTPHRQMQNMKEWIYVLQTYEGTSPFTKGLGEIL